MIKTTLLAAVMAVLLAACGTSTPYTAPTPLVAPRFAQAEGLAPGQVARSDWWTVFEDPALDHLMHRGLDANPDLRRAAERIVHSRALAAGAHAQRWPSADLGLHVREEQLSRLQAPGASSDERRSGSVAAGANLSWELDLFGRLRNAARASDARAQAVVADAQAVRLAVGAEIAQAWFELSGVRHQLRLAHRIVQNRQATLELVQRRSRAGHAAPLDEARARAELAAAHAELSPLEAALAVNSHRLAVLLGESPSTFEAPASLERPAVAVAVRVPDPVQWAAQRPDLKATEARLRALALDVEAVRAEFLPRLTIEGALGVAAGSLSGLASAGAATWFMAPSMSIPVFDRGRIEARLQAARSSEREALLAYHHQVLLATQEVESALARVRHGQRRLGWLQERSRQALQAEDLANRRFAAGGSDLLELLDAQRTAQQAEMSLAAQWTLQHQQVVVLQRALGARFEPVDAAAAATRLAGANGPA